MIKKPELLAPAGNPEKLKAAFLYGADAVYLGGKDFGLRALAGNFTADEMQGAVSFAHARGKKVYVTVNIYPHSEELTRLADYLKFLGGIGVDGLLVADLGVFSLARELLPQMPLHISTQANITNLAAAKAWQNLGASRLVLARELSWGEIAAIKNSCAAEIEIFVHGAMCISYSGRCLLSSYLTGRDANRGNCAQPCRWRYRLTEETRPGEYFPVEEDARGTYIFNSRDLCLMPYLKEIMGGGIDSLKIEGRMKSVHYVATVVKAYREAIDSFCRDPEGFALQAEWLQELAKVSHRAYTDGFFRENPGSQGQIYDSASYSQTAEFVGVVLSYDEQTGVALVEQRNRLSRGETIEILQPQGATFRQKIQLMYDASGNPLAVANHPRQQLTIKMERPTEAHSLVRRPIVM
ncbi:MAG: U32 family peptidase [Selenomonadaceae bacterium]|nr:U32 family peptidase [Selenomonadaceae bacterium]